MACQIGAVGVPVGICFTGSFSGLIASSFEVISQRCWAGCVGGRAVCVCELINLRCVFVGMCVKGRPGGVVFFLGGGALDADMRKGSEGRKNRKTEERKFTSQKVRLCFL